MVIKMHEVLKEVYAHICDYLNENYKNNKNVIVKKIEKNI